MTEKQQWEHAGAGLSPRIPQQDRCQTYICCCWILRLGAVVTFIYTFIYLCTSVYFLLGVHLLAFSAEAPWESETAERSQWEGCKWKGKLKKTDSEERGNWQREEKNCKVKLDRDLTSCCFLTEAKLLTVILNEIKTWRSTKDKNVEKKLSKTGWKYTNSQMWLGECKGLRSPVIWWYANTWLERKMYQESRFLSLLDCTVEQHFLKKTLHIYSKKNSSSEKTNKQKSESLCCHVFSWPATPTAFSVSRGFCAPEAACVSACACCRARKGLAAMAPWPLLWEPGSRLLMGSWAEERGMAGIWDCSCWRSCCCISW